MAPQASKKCGLLPPSRSQADRFLHEQRHLFGTGAWHLLRTHDLIARSIGIGANREKVLDTISRTAPIRNHKLRIRNILMIVPSEC